MSELSLQNIQLSKLPNRYLTLLRAGFKKGNGGRSSQGDLSLPKTMFLLDNLIIDGRKSAQFHQVVDWHMDNNQVHPCYLHTLSFPIHISMMLSVDFPFALLGLVHIENKITQFRQIENGEQLNMRCYFGELVIHPKGWMFSIETEFHKGEDLVWKSSSTNLYRTRHSSPVEGILNENVKIDYSRKLASLPLAVNLGRKYARASGDFNPIHLGKWSAKLFGFKQHIIHGMWTKSRCISLLHNYMPGNFSRPFEVSVAFKQPLYLPGQVDLFTEPPIELSQISETNFKVVSEKTEREDGSLHLVGKLKPY